MEFDDLFLEKLKRLEKTRCDQSLEEIRKGSEIILNFMAAHVGKWMVANTLGIVSLYMFDPENPRFMTSVLLPIFDEGGKFEMLWNSSGLITFSRYSVIGLYAMFQFMMYFKAAASVVFYWFIFCTLFTLNTNHWLESLR